MRHYYCAMLLALSFTQVGWENPGLQKKLGGQANEIKTLKSDLESLKAQAEFDKLLRNWDQIPYPTPGSRGYSTVKTNLGVITISLDNVQPYGNGTKVMLRFGNVTSASLDGVKAKLEYGTVDEKGNADNEHARSTDIDLLKSLYPGAWTSKEFILEGIPPTSLGFVRIRDLKTDRIRLH